MCSKQPHTGRSFLFKHFGSELINYNPFPPLYVLFALPAPSRLDVLATLTTDDLRVLKQLHSMAAKGKIDFVNALKVAKLALKFRQSLNHRQVCRKVQRGIEGEGESGSERVGGNVDKDAKCIH